MFEFLLFLIIGLTLFVPLSERGKLVAMIFYTVIMALWILAGATGYNVPHFNFGTR
jgi:hypothetical protein